MKSISFIITREQRGITLITLVVTIIVLIILAGVSIAMLVGENGIITQAQRAKENTELAEKQEKEDMGELEDELNEAITGIKVEQVTDENPGVLEGTGTDIDPYTINRIEDLIFFAYDVKQGNYYEGETVKLGLSLDFNSNKSYVDAYRTNYAKYGYTGELKKILTETGFIPIGTMQFSNGSDEINEKSFKGIFDGAGNKIYNLKIKQEIESTEYQLSIGLFSANSGTIQNLGIENGSVITNTNSEKFCAMALLVGNNRVGGIIRDCYTTGEISCMSSNGYNIGGVAGANDGEIYNCYNEVNMSIYKTSSIFESERETRGGGIAGSTAETSIIKNVYNKGNVLFLNSTTNEKGTNTYLAGIVGLNYGQVTNAYSIGKVISQEDEFDDVFIGNICGRKASGNIVNCYYLPNTILTSNTDNIQLRTEGQEISADKMKEENFVNLLNENNTEITWKLDIENINNRYPVLTWQ